MTIFRIRKLAALFLMFIGFAWILLSPLNATLEPDNVAEVAFAIAFLGMGGIVWFSGRMTRSTAILSALLLWSLLANAYFLAWQEKAESVLLSQSLTAIQTQPRSAPIEKEVARAAFEEVWQAFDREYPCFGLQPDLDWKALGKLYGKKAEAAETVFDVAKVINDCLAHLENLHVWGTVGDNRLPGYTRERPLNASLEATSTLAGATEKSGDELLWGRTEDGIGYLGIHGLTDPKLPERVDQALESLADTFGLVVDLRFNGGGSEPLALEIAGRFLDEERTYALNRYRSGPKHDDFGELLERRAGPRGSWRYQAPVIVLQGQRTMSSAESFVLMLAQCPQVTTMGDLTAGSSANPRLLVLDCGITVSLPRWLDMDASGKPVEHAGVAPAVSIPANPEDFDADHDPVLEAALKRLRAYSPVKRAPGKRVGG